MKNSPRISARRVFQGGAAFAAFGALTLAAASPAHADTYGWAYASAVGGQGSSETYITQEQTVSSPFSSSIGDWLVVEGTTTATVNADGATATTVIDSAKVFVTAENVEDILDPSDEDDDDDDEDDDESGDDLDEESPEGDEDDDESGDDLDEESPEDDDEDDDESGDDLDEESPEGDEDDDTPDEPSESPSESPSPAPSESAEEGDEEGDEESATASSEVIELDEENSELVDGSDTVILEGTITGITVTTTQSWDGEVSHHADEGTFVPASSVLSGDDGEELLLDIQPSVNQGVVQAEDAGFLWNDAYTNLYMNFLVNDEFVAGYSIAESAAGITTGVIDDGGDNGGDNGGNGGGGDGKNPPQKERDKDTLPKAEAKDAEPLAQTGSPVVGLIAAGAAIAAGGGAAAYLARRKKNNSEEATEAAETNEN